MLWSSWSRSDRTVTVRLKANLLEATWSFLDVFLRVGGVEEHHSQSSGGFCHLIHHKFRRSCKTYGMQALWRYTSRKSCGQGVTIEIRKHIFKIIPLWELVSKMFHLQTPKTLASSGYIGLIKYFVLRFICVDGTLNSLLTVWLPTHTLSRAYPES